MDALDWLIVFRVLLSKALDAGGLSSEGWRRAGGAYVELLDMMTAYRATHKGV